MQPAPQGSQTPSRALASEHSAGPRLGRTLFRSPDKEKEDRGCPKIWLPLYRWMVDFRENPSYKWMINGDTPILGNHMEKNYRTG